MSTIEQRLVVSAEKRYITQVFQPAQTSLIPSVQALTLLIILGLGGLFLEAYAPSGTVNLIPVTICGVLAIDFLNKACRKQRNPALPFLREEVWKPLQDTFLRAKEPLSTSRLFTTKSLPAARQEVISEQINAVYIPCEERCGVSARIIFEYYFDRWPNLGVAEIEGRHILDVTSVPIPAAVETELLNRICFDPSYRKEFGNRLVISLSVDEKGKFPPPEGYSNYTINHITKTNALTSSKKILKIALSQNPDDPILLRYPVKRYISSSEVLSLSLKKIDPILYNMIIDISNPPPHSNV